jgi:cytochrome c-type biogenesis protein CcmH
MSGFVFIAGLLTLAVLVALLYPLLRRREGSPEAWRTAGIAGLLVLVGAAALYPVWSDFDWNEEAPAADSPQAMVGRLARRLERNPDDLEGWLMLGRSYGVVAQSDPSLASFHELAARAYQRADTLAQGKSHEALTGLAESLIMAERSDLSQRAGRLFEQAMELPGAPVKALFYSALAARARNELPLARERFERMLQANPPPEVAQIIEQQLQEIDALAAMTAGAPGQGSAAPASAATPENVELVAIPLRITLAPAVAGKAVAGAPLFVVARIPGQRMPIAAKRVEARFPMDVDLLSSDAMGGAGTGFTAGQELEVEARIANAGGAISRSGDPFGSIRIKAGETRRAAIEINQLRP